MGEDVKELPGGGFLSESVRDYLVNGGEDLTANQIRQRRYQARQSTQKALIDFMYLLGFEAEDAAMTFKPLLGESAGVANQAVEEGLIDPSNWEGRAVSNSEKEELMRIGLQILNSQLVAIFGPHAYADAVAKNYRVGLELGAKYYDEPISLPDITVTISEDGEEIAKATSPVEEDS